MTDTPIPESLADHPPTIGEIRFDRSQNAAHWTPRDALIAMLRLIDSGEIDPDALVVVWRQHKGNGKTDSGYYAAAPDVHASLGLLTWAQHRIMKDVADD